MFDNKEKKMQVYNFEISASGPSRFEGTLRYNGSGTAGELPRIVEAQINILPRVDYLRNFSTGHETVLTVTKPSRFGGGSQRESVRLQFNDDQEAFAGQVRQAVMELLIAQGALNPDGTTVAEAVTAVGTGSRFPQK